MKKYKGIDVSLWQGDIDWTAVRKSGIDFAMIKASQGRTSDYDRPFTDPKFHQNANRATAAGVMWGAYHYLCARTESEAVEEAQYFCDLVEPYSDTMKLWAAVDVEDLGFFGSITKPDLTRIVEIFCSTVRDRGFAPMVYSSTWWLNARFDPPESVPLWEANLSVTARPKRARMWQHSFTGKVDGVNGDVDLNEGVNIIGDVNGDGKVNLTDAALILKHIAGWNPTVRRPQADVNNDGKITAADAAEILRIIAARE